MEEIDELQIESAKTLERTRFVDRAATTPLYRERDRPTDTPHAQEFIKAECRPSDPPPRDVGNLRF